MQFSSFPPSSLAYGRCMTRNDDPKMIQRQRSFPQLQVAGNHTKFDQARAVPGTYRSRTYQHGSLRHGRLPGDSGLWVGIWGNKMVGGDGPHDLTA